jgi:SAM-dependent methyltransferase
VTDADEARAINRALWDERARLHGTSPRDQLYDVSAFLGGRDTLGEPELELVGDVSGLDVLHLQCHFGMDTLSWARRGARITGVDFSPVAVERARALAAEAGLDAEFLEADTQALPSTLDGRFDLVVATYGVLVWISDLAAWFAGAHRALRADGGRLVLVDFHPAYTMAASVDPLLLDWPYGGGVPDRYASSGSYADPDLATTANEAVSYPHNVGEIVTAAAGAGFRIEWLGEHVDADRDGRGLLPRDPDGRYRFHLSDSALPVLYSLRALVS